MQLLEGGRCLDDAGESGGGKVCQFFWLHLVEPTAIHPAFLGEMLAGERLKMREDDRVETGPGREGSFHLTLGIKHQVDVRRHGLRLVPKEAERVLSAALTAHIGAEERGGGSLLLRIPRE